MKNIILLLAALVGTVMTVDAYATFGRFAKIAKPRLQHRVYSGFSKDCKDCVQELEKVIQQNNSTQDVQMTTAKHKHINSLCGVVLNLLDIQKELQKPTAELNLPVLEAKLISAKVTLELLEKNRQKTSLE